MCPARKPIDQSTFSRRFAARLRELREKSGMKVEDVVSKMQKAGYQTGVQTHYGWNANRQVNWDAVPAIAKALNTRPRDLMPSK